MTDLYHGTTSLFDEIDLCHGKGYKDFGRGFYATAIKHHAERMALRNKASTERRQQALKKRDASYAIKPVFAYVYHLHFDEKLAGMNVKRFDSANIEWARFILQNRKSPESAHDFDIVIGPTADAQTVLILNEYEEELEQSGYDEEVLRRMIEELEPENLPKQYFFGTKKALTALTFDRMKRATVG